ncbi:unnamed protein product [Durusdinium trenchii]|uniref:Uncharacterized protein n=2 Tax=Durusdinium trenchii TaxID=1381693 RepID=A0ABP0S1L6_9DINO
MDGWAPGAVWNHGTDVVRPSPPRPSAFPSGDTGAVEVRWVSGPSKTRHPEISESGIATNEHKATNVTRTIYQSRPEQTTRPTLPDPRKNFDLQRLNVNEGPADVEELLHPDLACPLHLEASGSCLQPQIWNQVKAQSTPPGSAQTHPILLERACAFCALSLGYICGGGLDIQRGLSPVFDPLAHCMLSS